jgi:clan AA aspartic protease (TIGR02281 family)
MTKKTIYCPACYSGNLSNSVYCCQCGSPMRNSAPAKTRISQWFVIVMITLFLSFITISAIYFLYSRQNSQPFAEPQSQTTQTDPPALQQEIKQASSQPEKNKKPSSARGLLPGEQQAEEVEKLIVGNVSIINPDGFTIAVFPAAVIGGSWLALPTRACVGGDKWFFSRIDQDEAIPIEGGLWGTGDTVGFWQLGGEQLIPGPDFAEWQQEIPVRFLSTKTNVLSKPMLLTPSEIQGPFLYSSLPGNLEPGVFLQNGNVVGWSFGDVLDGAYMWTLSHDTNLLYENYVNDFYYETFAGGREEYFVTALTTGRDSSPQRQLQIFIEGFRLPPKLLPEETPRFLTTKTVFPYISKLVNHMMDQGEYEYIATLVEEPLLWEMSDPELLVNVILATQNIYGNETAVNFIEESDIYIQQVIEVEKVELMNLHLKLYLEWIKNLLDNMDIENGWLVYNRAQPHFDESLELHLLGVELTLAENDWTEAESLLYQREYPAKFRETLMLLANRISDLKGQENKIVIRFQPGSSEIPVTVTVNDRIDHDFLVDTGASLVTVPYSTVVTLGLENKMSRHQYKVQTSGGIVFASAVMLSSIELQGWIVSDVKALVIDLPDRPGLGLLGLNFLGKFRFNLRADEGIFTLEPR